MAVAFDAKCTAVTQDIANASPITNTTLTIGASGTLLIAVFHACFTTTPISVPTAMTWNGVAMTLIGNTTESDSFANVYVYGLVSPATGNKTLSCSFTAGGGTGPSNYLDCFSFSGTDISSIANCCPAANVLTDATTPSGTVYPTTAFSVTTASGDAACAAFSDQHGAFSTANVGTLINFANIHTGNTGSLYNLAAGAATGAQFGGGAAGSPACGVAFRIIQPSGGGGGGGGPNAKQLVMM